MSTDILKIDTISNAYFRVPEMSHLLFDGKENFEQFQHIQSVFNKDEVLKLNPETINCSQKQALLIAAKKNLRFHELFNLNNHQLQRFTGLIMNEPLIQDVHFSMFIPTIETQATDQQLQYWMPQIRAMEVLGCYAQTELAHGSDVRSLETTATYDIASRQFILNTPSISSAKFWPGELGIFANHGVFQMQLVLDGKKLGIHHFVVPIRDPITYEPLEGIVAGDIGPKMAYKSKDNGFLLFQNFRIPRENMLMRYAQVTPEGEYKKNPAHNQQFAYVTMMRVRVTFISSSAMNLLKALTIAVRYAHIRSQFKDDNKQEIRVIEYQTQKQKLYPLLAEAYAMALTKNRITRLYQQMLESVQKNNDFSRLQPMHILLSACKSIFTHNAFFGIEAARQSCGGHGFSQYSGIPCILRQFAIAPTAEGENTMILMQAAQYLIKQYAKIQRDPHASLPREFQFLRSQSDASIITTNKQDLLNLFKLRSLFALKAKTALIASFNRIQKFTQDQGIQEAVDARAAVGLAEAATLFVHLFTFESFIHTLESDIATMSSPIRSTLNQLAQMYAYDQLLFRSNYLLESGQIQSETVKMIKTLFEAQLDEIHPMSLHLVDAVGFQDESLFSAIAVQNVPDIYSNMYQWAQTYDRVNMEQYQEPILENYLAIKGQINYTPQL